MDVGMIETTNYLDNHQYRENDTGDVSMCVDHFSPALLWAVALVFSLVFHVWLIKENQSPLMTKMIPELSGSQSISIQFTTFTPEQPVVEAKPKIENATAVPVKVTKPKPAVAKKEKLKVAKNKSDKAITLEKKKPPVPDPIRVVKTTTPTIEKEVAQLTKQTSTHTSNDKPTELIRPKKPARNNNAVKPEPASETVETYEFFPLIKNPKFLKPPTKPKYPRLARRKKQQGTSIIRAKISKQGTVDEVRLYQTSGYRLLDKSAMSALRRWQFEPATQAGVTVTAWVQVPVKFQLEN